MGDTLKIVVVGNGNAGAPLVDSLLAKGPERVHITLYGDEELGAYDRVRLSEFMGGTGDLNQLGMRSDGWYEERNV
jgi:nitrite reductase (NADH) large subunit